MKNCYGYNIVRKFRRTQYVKRFPEGMCIETSPIYRIKYTFRFITHCVIYFLRKHIILFVLKQRCRRSSVAFSSNPIRPFVLWRASCFSNFGNGFTGPRCFFFLWGRLGKQRQNMRRFDYYLYADRKSVFPDRRWSSPHIFPRTFDALERFTLTYSLFSNVKYDFRKVRADVLPVLCNSNYAHCRIRLKAFFNPLMIHSTKLTSNIWIPRNNHKIISQFTSARLFSFITNKKTAAFQQQLEHLKRVHRRATIYQSAR